MPSKKGRKIASRHSQINQRAKRKVTSHSLTQAQLQGPHPQGTLEHTDAVVSQTSTLNPASELREPNEQRPPLSTRARREIQAIAIESGPSLKSEVLRIGVIALIVGLALTGLKLSPVFG